MINFAFLSIRHIKMQRSIQLFLVSLGVFWGTLTTGAETFYGQRTDFLGLSRANLRIGLVNALLQFLLHAVVLGKFFHSHAKLVLAVAATPLDKIVATQHFLLQS